VNVKTPASGGGSYIFVINMKSATMANVTNFYGKMELQVTYALLSRSGRYLLHEFVSVFIMLTLTMTDKSTKQHSFADCHQIRGRKPNLAYINPLIYPVDTIHC